MFALIPFSSIAQTTASKISTGKNSETSPIFGSFANFIKNSENEAMFDDDVKEIVKKWQETNQKVIVYSVEDLDPGDKCDTDGNGTVDIFDVSSGDFDDDGIPVGQLACTFFQILEATKDTDIQVIALLPEKHQRPTIPFLNREAYDAATLAGDQASQRQLWLEALEKNFEHWSSVAQNYPQFAGINIDDFGQYICGPQNHDDNGNLISHNCYTLEEIQRLTDAAKTFAPLQFLPTLYLHYGWMTHLLPNTFTLGGRYDFDQFAGRYARLRYVFNPASGANLKNIRFSMMLVDYNDREAEDWNWDSDGDGVEEHTQASKSLVVNGNTVWTEPFEGEQYVNFLNENITANFNPNGINEIMISVTYDTNISSTNNTIMAISQPKLLINGKEVPCSLVTLEPNETGSTSIPKGSCVAYLERKGEDVSGLVAASNEGYRISDVIDGAFNFYSPRSSEYHANSHEALHKLTVLENPDLDFFAAYYANLWVEDVVSGTIDISSDDINPMILAEEISDAANAGVTGVLTWNSLAAVDEPGVGVFKERIPDDDVYTMRAYWPSYQPGFEGWFQQWVTKNKIVGDVTVCLKDNNTTVYDGDQTTMRYFTKTIGTRLDPSGAETMLYEDGVGGDELGSPTSLCKSTDEVITFTVDKPAYLTLGLNLVENVGNVNVTADFAVFVNDTLFARDQFDFSSDVSESLKDTWQAIVEAFAK